MAATSSITEAAARTFAKNAEPRSTLFCKRVTGFHLFKTNTGASWRYRYRDDLGKLRTVTIARLTEMKPEEAAQKAVAWRVSDANVIEEREQERQQRLEEQRKADARSLGQYLEGAYTAHQNRKRGGTNTLAAIRNHFDDWLGRDMAGLTRADVKAWQASKEKEGLAHTTLTRTYGALKTMLNHAVEEQALNENPLEKVHLDKPPAKENNGAVSENEAARRLLTPDELAGIKSSLELFAEEKRQERRNSRAHGKPHLPDLDHVAHPHWFIPFTLTALYTGLRPGDLYSLTWQELNINFKRLVKVPEKTQDQTNPAKIVMDLPAALIDVLKPWWQQQGEPAAGWVFPSPRTGQRMASSAHRRGWARLKELGDLPAELHFYSFRHNFISALVADGVPLLTVARLVGHKGTSMIELHYGHLCPTSAASALDVFSKRMSQPATEAANG